nr:hypothetical protein [Tanacetum cinerariifolium]
MVAGDDEMSKDKEIDKLMALISLSLKKIYKPTNNNLQTSSNTSRENQDNSPRINRGSGYDNQRLGNVAGARENVGRCRNLGFNVIIARNLGMLQGSVRNQKGQRMQLITGKRCYCVSMRKLEFS